MLPPVTEALNLLDVSLVNNDWQSNPGTLRRCIQILVDHISIQQVQLSRAEDILAAFGNPSQHGGTVWSKLAGKADLPRLEKLEQEVDQLSNELVASRSKQSDLHSRIEDVSSRVELVKDHVATVEARVGIISGPAISRFATPAGPYDPHRLAGTTHGSPSKPLAGSALDRIQRLEKKVESLTEATEKAEDHASSASSRLRELEPRVEAQLTQLRSDIKQALTVAAASNKADMEAETSSRLKELEKRMMGRVHGAEQQFENTIAQVHTRLASVINVELDKRFNTVFDHVDAQVSTLQNDIDRLSNDKADTAMVESSNARLATVMQQLGSSLADDISTARDDMESQLGQIRQEAADKDKVLQEFVQKEVDNLRGMQAQIHDVMTLVKDTLSNMPRPEEVRSRISYLAADLENVQRSISGLNSALSSTSNALELQAQKLASHSSKISNLGNEVASVKESLYGPSSNAMTAALDAAADRQDGSWVVGRLTALERALSDLATSVSTKADDSQMRDAERRLAGLVRQVDVNTDSVKTLTNSTYKRVDEHASAIQRLTLAITSNLEERPTSSAVRSLVEQSCLELRERCESALLPLWDAVKIMQASLRDATDECKTMRGVVLSIQQSQADMRSKMSQDKGSLVSAVRRAVEEEVGVMRADMEPRLSALDTEVKQARAQLDVHAQLQDRHSTITTALQDQLEKQAASSKAGYNALRQEITTRLDSTLGSFSSQVQALELAVHQHGNDLQAVRNQLGSIPSDEALGRRFESVSRAVCRQELSKHTERDEGRWQLWLERTAEGNWVRKSELEAIVSTAMEQALRDSDSQTASQLGELANRLASMKGELEHKLKSSAIKMEGLDVRIEAVESLVASAASQKDLLDLSAVLESKADKAYLEARLRQAAADAARSSVTRAELEIELAKKLDISAYIKGSASRDALAAASALASSPPRRLAAPVSTASPSSRANDSSRFPSSRPITDLSLEQRAAEILRSRAATTGGGTAMSGRIAELLQRQPAAR